MMWWWKANNEKWRVYTKLGNGRNNNIVLREAILNTLLNAECLLSIGKCNLFHNHNPAQSFSVPGHQDTLGQSVFMIELISSGVGVSEPGPVWRMISPRLPAQTFGLRTVWRIRGGWTQWRRLHHGRGGHNLVTFVQFDVWSLEARGTRGQTQWVVCLLQWATV